MTATVEICLDSAAEHVFATATAAHPGPAPSSADCAPHLTLVGRPMLPDAAPRASTAVGLLHPPSVPEDVGSEPARPSSDGTVPPRIHLLPAPPPARRRTVSTPLGGPPPTLAERVRVLRADDRSLETDEPDHERGARPVSDPGVVARRLAGATVEVIVGRRPAAQLARWLAPGVLDALRARAVLTRHALAVAATRAPSVRGVRVCELHEHLVEATAVVDDGRRVRAIALRLEAHRGTWRATALEIG